MDGKILTCFEGRNNREKEDLLESRKDKGRGVDWKGVVGEGGG